jgi:hypothetical protein
MRHGPNRSPEGVGQEDDRGHVLEREPAGPMARSKHSPGVAARRSASAQSPFRPNITEQVGLLVLGRHPGRWSGALDVDDDQWQLDHDGEAHRLRLERDAGPRRGSQRERAAI